MSADDTYLFLLCLLVISSATLLYGQAGATGDDHRDRHIDNSGAVVAKVSVDVTNIDTAVTKHTETTLNGGPITAYPTCSREPTG